MVKREAKLFTVEVSVASAFDPPSRRDAKDQIHQNINQARALSKQGLG